MRLRVLIPVAMVAAVALSFLALRPGGAAAQASTTLQVGGNAGLGSFLTGPDGMTLYIFTNDKPDESVCFNQCEQNWPPLTVATGVTPTKASGIEGTLGVYVRPDGSRQVTLDGKPLYYWAFDEAVGDSKGEGVGGVWFVVSAASDSEILRAGSSDALGPVLTGPNGMTLYIFTNDAANESACYGQCASNWPPLVVDAGATPVAAPGLNAGVLGTTERTDGTTQVTLDGRPLYYWAFDQAVGDSTGHGVGGVWFALDAAGEAYATPAPAATATAAPTTAAATPVPTKPASTPSAPSTGTGTDTGSGPGNSAILFAALAGAVAVFGIATGFAVRARR